MMDGLSIERIPSLLAGNQRTNWRVRVWLRGFVRKSEPDGVVWRLSDLLTGDGLQIHTRHLRDADPAKRHR